MYIALQLKEQKITKMIAKGLTMNIVLLTDFGYQDGFVGVMKGVIKSLSPHVNLIDLAHSVPDYDILRGALLLEAHYSYFPKGTIFLCVIDPRWGMIDSLLLSKVVGIILLLLIMEFWI